MQTPSILVYAPVGQVHAFRAGDGSVKYYGAHKRSGATFAARTTEAEAATDVQLCEAGKPVPMPHVLYLEDWPAYQARHGLREQSTRNFTNQLTDAPEDNPKRR